MRTRYSYDGTPGTYERGAAEYQRQRGMIEAAGGVLWYLQGARPRDEKSVDGRVLDVVSYKRRKDRKSLA